MTDVVELERRINAPRDTVFAYFTDPDRYTRWMGHEAELDARPGGIYRVHVVEGSVARGEFVEVEPPERVVFTWGWEGNPMVPPGSSRVEVTFRSDGGDTVVTLTHSGLPDADAMRLHEDGWTRYLDQLVADATP
ncbi:MAG: SRPBCC family protein [Nitriliruptorales bacterium]|nr:SRPBCC family protein [Nitriliruptorales bacterium]